jgi:hypothetical protein
VNVDEAAIAALEHNEPGWHAEAGPHVRPTRAGLRLSSTDEADA